jgi:predicted nucleic acid-binding protein
MVKSVTIDSSVIISSLLPNEKRHEEARQIWGKVLSGETPAVMPYSVLVEVVASSRLRNISRLIPLDIVPVSIPINSDSSFLLEIDKGEIIYEKRY